MKPFFISMLVSICLGPLLSGCNKANAPPLIQVTGEVVDENGPVAGVWIEFHPAQGRMSSAMTDDQGEFQLRYTLEHAGAVPGAHTVHFHLPPRKAPVPPSHYNPREQQEFVERNSQPAKIAYEQLVEVTQSDHHFHFDLSGKTVQ